MLDNLKRNLNYRANIAIADLILNREAVPLPLRGEGFRQLRIRECGFPYRGERSVAALPGGAKPIAGFAAMRRGVGWRGSPLRTITGADSGFRRAYGFHPRRAKRRAQVCGEVTFQSD